MNARLIDTRGRGLTTLRLLLLGVALFAITANTAGAYADISQPSPAAALQSVIRGTVSYDGSVTGTHVVWIGAFLTLAGGPPAYAVQRDGPGPYELTLPAGTYYIMAGMDADDSGGAPDPAIDPLGAYAGNPVAVADGAIADDIDVVLLDPGAQPGGGSIGGQISYTGRITGTHNTVIVAARVGEQQPAFATVIQGTGPYTIAGVADGSYTVFAFMDLDGDMGPPQPDEPAGWHDPNGDGVADVVTVIGGNAVAGIDIALRDPARRLFLPLMARQYGHSGL